MESSVIFHVNNFTRLLATSWFKRSVRTDKDAVVIERGVGRSRKDKHLKKNMGLLDRGYNSTTSNSTDISEQVFVKISIINEKAHTVLQEILPSQRNCKYVKFLITKEDIIDSKSQKPDGNLIFCCKIFSHAKKNSIFISRYTWYCY
jgi:hypothetical protein